MSHHLLKPVFNSKVDILAGTDGGPAHRHSPLQSLATGKTQTQVRARDWGTVCDPVPDKWLLDGVSQGLLGKRFPSMIKSTAQKETLRLLLLMWAPETWSCYSHLVTVKGRLRESARGRTRP